MTEIRKIAGIWLTLAISMLLALAMAVSPAAAGATPPATRSQDSRENLVKQVRHELTMLPWYGVFDNLEFSVNGGEVTLTGQVVRPTLKDDAEGVVKKINGVTRVENRITVLPPSGMDDQIRREVYRAIYSDGTLNRYSLGAVPAIHIIVDSGHVMLVGYVDRDADRNLAYLRANAVPGVFSVTNNLRVE